MRRTARDLGTVVMAAGGTLLLLAGYQLWEKREKPADRNTGQTPVVAPLERNAAPAAGQSAPEPNSPDSLGAARGALGPDGEVLADVEFPGAGRQVLAAQRMPTPGAPPPGNPPEGSRQEGETTAEVIRVSILVLENGKWKEAFRADEHLKNRRGYFTGAPAESVPGWHLEYSKTADAGFRLEFTPLGLATGKKPSPVRAAWNAKRREYDAVKGTGTGFLEVSPTPGNAPIPIKP